MAKLSYLEAIRQAQDLALQQNKDVFILGEDVGKKGGVFGTTQGLRQQDMRLKQSYRYAISSSQILLELPLVQLW